MAPRSCLGFFVFVLGHLALRSLNSSQGPPILPPLPGPCWEESRLRRSASTRRSSPTKRMILSWLVWGEGGGSLLMFLGTLHDAFLEFGSNKKCKLGFVLFCFSGFFETVSHSVDQTSLAFAGILCLCHPSAIMTTLPISFTYLRDSALDYFTNL